MAIGSESMVSLARSIVAVGSHEREAGAENASDWVAIFDHEEAEAVALLLANAASIEMDSRVREAQIHAILEISDIHPLRSELLRSLNRLNRENLDSEQFSYLNELGLGPGGGEGPPA